EIPIARGRNFTAEEIADAARFTQTSPVIVSQATARNLWPAEDPIGQTLLLGDATLQVVGVAADAQVTTIGRTDPYYLYRPASTGQVLLVRGLTDFGPMASAIRAAAQSLSPPPTVRVRPLEANLAWWRGLSGTLATLGTSLGLLALVLASVGIYGV